MSMPGARGDQAPGRPSRGAEAFRPGRCQNAGGLGRGMAELERAAVADTSRRSAGDAWLL